MALLPMHSFKQSLSKPLVLLFALSAITVIVCIFCLEFQSSTQFTNTDYKDLSGGLYSRNSINQSNSFHISNVENNSSQGKKIIIAFGYWEQLSRATQNLLDLTALAAYGGRQAVVPFVRSSSFYGTCTRRSSTLALYFNVTALNRSLVSHGYGALTNWKDFQDVCKGRLDVLVYFDYTNLTKTKTYSLETPYIPACKNCTIQGIKIATAIRVNVFALDSAARFEVEVAERLPCVGIYEWRGVKESNKAISFRAQFDFSSVIRNVLYFKDTSAFFNSELLRIAKDFISENLGPIFMSVHLRTEHMLKKGRNISMINKCLSKLTARVQIISNANTVPLIPVFMATDFTEFGSSSRMVKTARENAQLLKETLGPLKAITFQPAKYKLNDRGAVAIVEMNILASGKHLVVVGGGNFQFWLNSLFLNKNGHDYTKIETLVC